MGRNFQKQGENIEKNVVFKEETAVTKGYAYSKSE